MTLEEFRAKYPIYNDLSDEVLVGKLHQKFYSDMPIEEFNQALEYTPFQTNVRPTTDPGSAIQGLESSARRFSNLYDTFLSLSGDQEAFDRLERQGKEEEIYAQGLASLDSIGDQFDSGDYWGGIKSLTTDFMPQLAGESAIDMATMIAGGMAGAAIGTAIAPGPGSVAGGVAGAVAPFLGVTGGIMAGIPSFVGVDVGRQISTPQVKDVDDLNLLAVGAAAPVQASLEYAIFFALRKIPGLGAMAEAPLRRLMDQTVRALSTKEGAKIVAKAAVTGLATESVTEAAQSYIERLQAGLPVHNHEAFREYIHSAIAGGLLGGPIGVIAGGVDTAVVHNRLPGLVKARDDAEKLRAVDAAANAAYAEQQKAEMDQRALPAPDREDPVIYDVIMPTGERGEVDQAERIALRIAAKEKREEFERAQREQQLDDAASAARDGRTYEQESTRQLMSTAQEVLTSGEFTMDQLPARLQQIISERAAQRGHYTPDQDVYTLSQLEDFGATKEEVAGLRAERFPEATIGEEITEADIVAAAEAKNIRTGTKSFNALARRVVGESKVSRMTGFQRNLLFDTINRMPAFEEQVDIPNIEKDPYTFEQYVAVENQVIENGVFVVDHAAKLIGVSRKEAMVLRSAMLRNGLLTKKGSRYKSNVEKRRPDVPEASQEPVFTNFPGESRRKYIVKPLPDGKRHAVVARGYKFDPVESDAQRGRPVSLEGGRTIWADESDEGNYVPVGDRTIDIFDSKEEADAAAEEFQNNPLLAHNEGQVTDIDLRTAGRSIAERVRRTVRAGSAVGNEEVVERLTPGLTELLEKIGGEKIGLEFKLVNSIRGMGIATDDFEVTRTIEGALTGDSEEAAGIILLALDATDAAHLGAISRGEGFSEEKFLAGVLGHEILHALRNQKVITKAMWKNLKAFVKNKNRLGATFKGKPITYLEQARKAYENRATTEATDRGMSGVEFEEFVEDYITEEAVAEALRDFIVHPKYVTGKPASIFRKILNFLKRLGQLLQKNNIQSLEDIYTAGEETFAKVLSGEAVTEAVAEGIVQPLESMSTRLSVADPVAERYSDTTGVQDDTDRQRDRSNFVAAETGEVTPLRGIPEIEGATGPVPGIHEVARGYAEGQGLTHHRQRQYVDLDVERSAEVAQAYEDMVDDASVPEVREAYASMIEQTGDQYQALLDAGYSFRFFDPENDPYNGNAWNAIRELHESKTMAIFPTDAGYGTDTTEFNDAKNPLLRIVDLQIPNAEGDMVYMRANDVFRVVHDVFGHGMEGAGFRARGEENAWLSHTRLFTGAAIGAVTSETRGQNSWLNHGPHGETNRTAKIEDTVFADQKIGLMPEWTWREAGGLGSDTRFSIGEVNSLAASNLLTDQELDLVFTGPGAQRRAERLMGIFGVLPDQAEMAVAAYTGRSKREWYIRSAKTIEAIFGHEDARRFVALLAATSARTRVEKNLESALNIWKKWNIAGRPRTQAEIENVIEGTKWFMRGSHGYNTIRVLSAENGMDINLMDAALSGPKVDSFMRNLLGATNEVTNDTHMATYFGLGSEAFAARNVPIGRVKPRQTPSPDFMPRDAMTKTWGLKDVPYLAASARTRQTALHLSALTGQTWTPSEVQSSIWAFTKTLVEMMGRGKDGAPIDRLIGPSGWLNQDMLSRAPEFGDLFAENIYRKILITTPVHGGPEYADAIQTFERTHEPSRERTQRERQTIDPYAGKELELSDSDFTELLTVSAERVEGVVRRGIKIDLTKFSVGQVEDMSVQQKSLEIWSLPVMKHFRAMDVIGSFNDAMNDKSRSTIVFMRPEDYLLAISGHAPEPGKAMIYAENTDRGMLLNEIPWLDIYDRESGALQVRSHNGRHRAHALRALGYEFIPVVIKHDMRRWGENQGMALPTVLENQMPGGAPASMPDSVYYPVRDGHSVLSHVLQQAEINRTRNLIAGVAPDETRLREMALRNFTSAEERPFSMLAGAEFDGHQQGNFSVRAMTQMMETVHNRAMDGGALRAYNSYAFGMFAQGAGETSSGFEAVFPANTDMENVNATAAEIMMFAKEQDQEQAFAAMEVPLDYKGDNVRPAITVFFMPNTTRGMGGERTLADVEEIIDDLIFETEHIAGFTAFAASTGPQNLYRNYQGIRFIWMPEYYGDVTEDTLADNRDQVARDFEKIAKHVTDNYIGSVRVSQYIAALGKRGAYDQVIEELSTPGRDSGGDVGELGEAGPWRRSVGSRLSEGHSRGRERDTGTEGVRGRSVGPTKAKFAVAHWRDVISSEEWTRATTLVPVTKNSLNPVRGYAWLDDQDPYPVVLPRGLNREGKGFGNTHMMKHDEEFEAINAPMFDTLRLILDDSSKRKGKITTKPYFVPSTGKLSKNNYTMTWTASNGREFALGLEKFRDHERGITYAMITTFYPVNTFRDEVGSRASDEDIKAYRELRDKKKKGPSYAINMDHVGGRLPVFTAEEARAAEIDLTSNEVEGRVGRAIGRVMRSDTGFMFGRSIVDVRHEIQDKMLSAQMLIELVRDAGGTVSDAFNFYMKEQLSQGRIPTEIENRNKALYTPYMDFMKAKDTMKVINDDDLYWYLYARHAPERNREVLKMQSDPKSGIASPNTAGSGMTDSMAAQIMNEFSPDQIRALEQAASLIDTIVADTTATRIHGRLIDKATATASPYEFYVPLMGFAEEDMDENPDHPMYGREKGFFKPRVIGMRLGKSKGIQGLESKRLVGRQSKAGHIVSHILLQNHEAVARSERNRVLRSFGDFIAVNKDVRIKDDRTMEMTPLTDVAEIITTGKGQNMKLVRADQNRHGVVKLVHDAKFKAADDVLIYKDIGEDGRIKEIAIRISDERLLRSMQGASAPDMSGIVVRGLMTLNRYLASVNTSWNPEFILSNFFKDLTTAGIVSGQFNLPKLQREVMMNVRKSIAGLEFVLREDVGPLKIAGVPVLPGKSPHAADNDHAASFREMRAAGGTTEFLGIKNIQSILSDIRSELKSVKPGMKLSKTKTFFTKKILRHIEDYNKVAENAMRLSLYHALRGRNVSIEQAAFAAKNLTVNFNKGGHQKAAMNGFYLFYNASIQGSWVLVNALKTKRVQKITAAVVAAGFMNDMIQGLIMSSDKDDDGKTDYDELEDWRKEHTMIFMDPLGRTGDDGLSLYLGIPMPYGFNAFFNMGRAFSAYMRGAKKLGESASSVIYTFADSFNPLGGSENFLNFVAPTILDVPIELAANSDFTGRSIVPERIASGARPAEPDSQLYWNNTNPALVSISDWMNQITGGSKWRSGYVDWSPATMEHVIEYATGGAGKFVMRTFLNPEATFDNTMNMIRGDFENVDVNQISFLRKLVGNVGNVQDTIQYYENANDVLTAEREYRGFLEAGDINNATLRRKRYAPQLQIAAAIKNIDSELAKLRSSLKDVRTNPNISEAVRERWVEQIKKQMDRQIDLANRIYNSAMRRAKE